MLTLAQKIQLVRASKGLSREIIAKALHLSIPAYGKIERGDTEISVERLNQIANILGVSKQYIEEYDTQNDHIIYAHTANDQHLITTIHNQVNEVHEKLIDSLRDQLKSKDQQITELQASVNRLLGLLER